MSTNPEDIYTPEIILKEILLALEGVRPTNNTPAKPIAPSLISWFSAQIELAEIAVKSYYQNHFPQSKNQQIQEAVRTYKDHPQELRYHGVSIKDLSRLELEAILFDVIHRYENCRRGITKLST